MNRVTTVPSLAVGAPRARHAREAVALAGVATLALLAALALDRSLALGVLVALVPIVPLLLSRPRVTGVLAIGLLPFSADLLGNGPIRISLPDVLLILALLGTAAIATAAEWRALRPVVLVVAVYTATLIIAVAAHLGPDAIVNSVQRLQILIVPLVVGALTLRRDHLDRALDAYIVTAALLGVAFAAELLPKELAFQKNPVGQYIGGALLVIMASPGRRWRWAAVPVLAYGLFDTASRGALLGLILGLVVLLIAGVGTRRVRTAALLVPLVVVLGIAFLAAPDDVQRRTTTLSSERAGDVTSGEYTIRIRQAYQNDALGIIRSEPLTGMGIGNYRSGTPSEGTLTDDPHNVVLLEAAEGGLPLLAGFALLIGGTALLLWQRRRETPLAVLALAVQASTVGHGCVDIYWVRGTPVLGWLLIGAALADAHRRRTTW